MKIKSLKISNILSFKYFENVDDAPELLLDPSLNIIIGENGAGKSTALEVINFIFKKVIFKQFEIKQDLYGRKSTMTIQERKEIISANNNQTYSGFRLEPNWDTEDKPRTAKLVIELDQIDKQNIDFLSTNKEKLTKIFTSYSNIAYPDLTDVEENITINVVLNTNDNEFTFDLSPNPTNASSVYFTNYNAYKNSIRIYNDENKSDPLPQLHEPFTLIVGYRNYNTFTSSVSLSSSSAAQQMQDIRNLDYGKSLNTTEQLEPGIFNLVRLGIAERHYNLDDSNLNNDEREKSANELPFLQSINKRLKLINLNCKIRLNDLRTWQYIFEFIDIKRNKPLGDINSLSAGQKSIIHLVFEAYGRGDLKGGLVIIDEPEIHLHHQFQNEYLKILRDINKEQSSQYVLVTHSESLINSETINYVKRFALDENNNTIIKVPTLNSDQKTLIKILDNIRCTYALFSKKIILVEGDTDRYFYKSFLQAKYASLVQEISIIDIGGKGSYSSWASFFESLGLEVSFIGDLDAAFNFIYATENSYGIKTDELIKKFREEHADIDQKIKGKYDERIYILKHGELEDYLGIHNKGLPETIKFCNEKLDEFVANQEEKAKEVKEIFEAITK